MTPVSKFLMCIPCLSTNARYLPSGEMEPNRTGFSDELIVSGRNLIAGEEADGCRFRNQVAPPASNSEARIAPTHLDLSDLLAGDNPSWAACRSAHNSA